MMKNQHGFGLLGVILVAVVLVAAGAAGFYVYSENNTDSKNDLTPQASQPMSQEPEEVSEKYIEIKELGIKIPLKGDFQGITYSYDGERVYLESKKLENLFVDECFYEEPHSKGAEFIALIRRDSDSSERTEGEEEYVKFGGFSINGWTLVDACVDSETFSTIEGSTYEVTAGNMYDSMVETLKDAQEI